MYIRTCYTAWTVKKNLTHFTHTIPSMSMWGYNDRPSSLAAHTFTVSTRTYLHMCIHKYIINTDVRTYVHTDINTVNTYVQYAVTFVH